MPFGRVAWLWILTLLAIPGLAGPVIQSYGVQNAAGYQITLSPGVVFVVLGTGLGPSALATASAPNYPALLAGTSVSLTPETGGPAIAARMVYTTANQVAAVVPSNVALGVYLVRVTYNNESSDPWYSVISARTFGIVTSNSAGTGLAQATLANVNGGISLIRNESGTLNYAGLNWVLTPAHPGDIVTLWGTGGGADVANDTGGSSGDQTDAANIVVTLGSRTIRPLYAGTSPGYPGLWQVNFTIPPDMLPNCATKLEVAAGGPGSNRVTIPIAATGKTICVDPPATDLREPEFDRPTLTTLGIRWPFPGDSNFNARVSVRYRKAGTTTWFDALPLFHVHPAETLPYVVEPQFAGSIFDLRPGTSYEVELHVVDPDGPIDRTITMTGSTRDLPKEPRSPRIVSVNNADAFQAAMLKAQPGEVISLADGVYSGQYFTIHASGTPDNPIVIRGASQDGTILDGQNCGSCNVVEVYGSYVRFERMTIQNGSRGIRFQGPGAVGNMIRRVHMKSVDLGVGSQPLQRDFYICDNIMEGRLAWPRTYLTEGGQFSALEGITVDGSGHVVCHNQLSGFGDSMTLFTYGARGDDFYGNDVLWNYDDGIQMDGGEGNVRVFRNRFTNSFTGISFQPILGGPAYAFKNIAVNIVREQLKIHGEGVPPGQQTSGMLIYNNTFLSYYSDLVMYSSNIEHHFVIANNLFIGPSTPIDPVVGWDGSIDDGLFDYNGYFRDGRFYWNFVQFGYKQFANFAEAQVWGMEPHGFLLTTPIFSNGLQAPSDYVTKLTPKDVSLSAQSNAVDKGLLLPNVNDRYRGKAPDLGAQEAGCPLPIYGPRPEGVDESNQVLGCDAVGSNGN
jgi:uncharacterized protein (TIGR03437 family)